MTPASPVLLRMPELQQHETIFAKDQSQYRPLPALRLADETGTVITRWRLTWRERLRVLLTGNVWLQQLAFGGPLQPQLPSVVEPKVVTQ